MGERLAAVRLRLMDVDCHARIRRLGNQLETIGRIVHQCLQPLISLLVVLAWSDLSMEMVTVTMG